MHGEDETEILPRFEGEGNRPLALKEGTWNRVHLFLELTGDPAANEDEVIDRLNDLIDPYGGLGAYGRDIQISNSFIDSELQQQRVAAARAPLDEAVRSALVPVEAEAVPWDDQCRVCLGLGH